MRKLCLGLVAAGICWTHAARAAEAGVVFASSTPWHVDWADKSCVLGRGFGPPNDMTILRFERFAPTDDFQLSLIGKEMGEYHEGYNLQVQFGEGEPRRINYQTAKTDKNEPALFLSSLALAARVKGGSMPQVTPAMERAVRSISILSGKKLTLVTGPLDVAFAALRQCTDDLVRSWGLDPVQQASLMRRPEPLTSPSIWIANNDYPANMLELGAQALVSFRLAVSATGEPTACEIQRSHNKPIFDQTTCMFLMRRARFKPALDSVGKPVASFFVQTVRWIVG